MKKTDIAMIVLIAGFSVLVSYLVINSLVQGGFSEQTYEVKETSPISNEYVKPSSDIFNSEAINPTVQINIGQ
ncbi:hypothetical protein HG452_002145 [Candidatus Saccharibacteria bacterium]|jgi:hypothetical protein cdiviTM7_02684|nr:hypothetical protein [Candidatus Saccharibacteria bacterium]